MAFEGWSRQEEIEEVGSAYAGDWGKAGELDKSRSDIKTCRRTKCELTLSTLLRIKRWVPPAAAEAKEERIGVVQDRTGQDRTERYSVLTSS